MCRAILVLLVAGGLAAIGFAPAAAVGTRYPFCIQGEEQPGLSNCTFTSYEQCQATASGRFLSCIANPYYAGPSDAPESRLLSAPARPHTAARLRLSAVLNAGPSIYSRLAINFCSARRHRCALT